MAKETATTAPTQTTATDPAAAKQGDTKGVNAADAAAENAKRNSGPRTGNPHQAVSGQRHCGAQGGRQTYFEFKRQSRQLAREPMQIVGPTSQ